MTLRASPFFAVFRTILGASGVLALPACGWSSCPDSGPTSPSTASSTKEVWFHDLQSVLADGSVTEAECAALCRPSFDQNETCSLTYDEDEYELIRADAEGVGGAGGAGGVGGEGGSAVDASLPIACEMTGYYACEGRRHVTWGRRGELSGRDALGRWLARASANEAGSVRSFRCLALEISRLGVGRAGRGKVWARRLRQAARDEIRHARALDRLAQQHGSTRPKQEFRVSAERTLLELALENAREGCVGETWAGLVALHQADTAGDPGVRAALSFIARDEATHADLAWDLHEWLMTELVPAEREQLARALDAQIAQLESGVWALSSAELPEPARRALGLPTPLAEERLQRQLGRELQSRRVPA